MFNENKLKAVSELALVARVVKILTFQELLFVEEETISLNHSNKIAA